jgi:hypothetical protein
MANTYSITCHTWKWTKKLFIHLLGLTILNSYIRFSLCGGKKITRREFQLALVRNVLAHAVQQPHVQRLQGRPANVVSKVSRLNSTDINKH